MIDLVGFDLILQLHRHTVADLLNRAEHPLPGGGTFHLFGGRHPLELELDALPGTSSGLVCGGFAEHRLRAVPGQSVMRIESALTRVALQDEVSGTVVTQGLGATTVAEVPFAVAPPPPGTFPALNAAQSDTIAGVQVDFTQAQTDLDLDLGSRAALEAAVGVTAADVAENGLRLRFRAWVHGFGTVWIPLGAAGLRVVEGQDSTTPMTLAAWPTVRWIDSDTLALLGHHRAGGQAGQPQDKPGGGLASPGEERVEGTSPVLGRTPVPAHRFSIEMSADSVLRMMVAPALRHQVVRGLLKEWRMRDFVHAEENAYYHDRYREALREHGPADAFAMAEDDLEEALEDADIVAGMRARANARLEAHLDSPYGRDEITAFTPPPFGSGTAHKRIVMPSPFSDVIADVTRIAAALQPGRIAIDVDNRAEPPVCSGTQRGSVGVDLFARVDESGSIVLDPRARSTESELDGLTFCTLVLAALGSLVAGPVPGVTFAAVARVLAEALAESIAADSIATELAGRLEPVEHEAPAGAGVVTRVIEVEVDRPGLRVVGLIGTDPFATNDLQPRVEVDVVRLSRTPSLTLPERGTFHKERSCLDGGPRDFGYTRRWTDETWQVRVRAVDLTPPVRFAPWTIRLGDVSENAFDPDTGLLDAGWVGVAVPLTEGDLELLGPVVSHEAVGGGPAGLSDVVRIGTTRVGRDGWQVATRGPDGDYALLLHSMATDADGRAFPVKARVFVDGTRVTFDADAEAESRACLDRLAEELEKRPPDRIVVEVPPWRRKFEPWPGVELDPGRIRLDPGGLGLDPRRVGRRPR